MTELETKIIGQFQLLYDWLLQQDKKLVIHSWHGATVLKRGIDIPQNWRALEAYTEGLYIQSSQSTWTRISSIGHNILIKTLTDSDWASANDYAIAIAKLQVKSTCAIGWLLGSHRDMNSQKFSHCH
jgi:hypothetical protein